MRKSDEIALYAYMRCGTEPGMVLGTLACRTNDAAKSLGIPMKRAHYLVEKWMRSDWCDGVSTHRIYFYSTSPVALLPWGVRQ